MKRNICLAFTLFMACAASAVQAGEHAIAGAGAISCERFLNAQTQDKTTSLATILWLQGFLSGVNMQRNLDLKVPLQALPEPPEIKAFTVDYCTRNPGKSVFEAAMWLSLKI